MVYYRFSRLFQPVFRSIQLPGGPFDDFVFGVLAEPVGDQSPRVPDLLGRLGNIDQEHERAAFACPVHVGKHTWIEGIRPPLGFGQGISTRTRGIRLPCGNGADRLIGRGLTYPLDVWFPFFSHRDLRSCDRRLSEGRKLGEVLVLSVRLELLQARERDDVDLVREGVFSCLDGRTDYPSIRPPYRCMTRAASVSNSRNATSRPAR